MNNFPGKKFSNLVYWLSSRYSIGTSGIAAWLACGAMCAFGLSGSLAMLVITSSPSIFLSHMIILLVFFAALTVLKISLKYTSETNNVLIIKAILYLTSTALITSSFANVRVDQSPVLVMMLVIILFTETIRRMFLEVEEQDQKALDKGHLPEMRSNDIVVVLSSLSTCFTFVTAMGSWIKYYNGYCMDGYMCGLCSFAGIICCLCVYSTATHTR